jgi:cell division protein ZapE
MEGDALPTIARGIVQSECRLLCLDEFQVTDVADAMILQHLFGALFAEGLVLVATSNRNPDDLYKGGINRPVFLPFIGVLKRYTRAPVFPGPLAFAPGV